MRLTFRQLQIIAAVAKHQQITAAAEALHLTQPGVSTHLKQIEAQLGYTLFKRINNKWILTRAGQAVWPQITALFTSYDNLMQSLVPNNAISGQISIALPSGISHALLPMLHKFQQKHQAVNFKIDISDRMTHYQKLQTEDIDIAFMGEPQTPHYLISHHIFSYETVVIAPRHFLNKWPLPPTNTYYRHDRLHKLPWIMPPLGTNSHRIFKQYFYQAGMRITPVNQMQSLLEMVALGMGLAVVPQLMLQPHITKRVVIVPVAKFPLINHTHLVHQESLRLTPALQTFIESAHTFWRGKLLKI